MAIILFLLLSFGIAFFIKDSDGPFGSMNWLRSKSLSSKRVGVFFYKLFSCYFCLGFWAGLASYFLIVDKSYWNFHYPIVYGFSGATFCLIVSAILERLNERKNT